LAISIATDTFHRFERLSFVSRQPAAAGLGGEHRSRRPSPSTDYVDYRPYQPGDDFRRVDWNVYGRLGSLQVKLTEGRERMDIVLVLDCSSSMAYGAPDKLAFATQLVAALAHVGVARSDAVRINCLDRAGGGALRQTPLGGLGAVGRRGRLPEVVGALSQVGPVGLVDLNASLVTCLPAETRNPLVVVVSDLLTPGGVAQGLHALQVSRADVVVLHVVSPEEVSPRVAGEVELVDAETHEVLEVGVSIETLVAYRARFQQWLHEREVDCTSRGMRYVRVPTDRPLAVLVLDDLRRAGVLR
jgi:uncharacterized protein (DUF58 family)